VSGVGQPLVLRCTGAEGALSNVRSGSKTEIVIRSGAVWATQRTELRLEAQPPSYEACIMRLERKVSLIARGYGGMGRASARPEAAAAPILRSVPPPRACFARA
jgi:hypothetical protein